MPEIKISSPVGENAKNNKSDVSIIQQALNQIIKHNVLVPLGPLKEDGIAGRNTKTAIRQFQRMALGMGTPDGRIDTGGKTLGKINAVLTTASSAQFTSRTVVKHDVPGNDVDAMRSEVFKKFNSGQLEILSGAPLHNAQVLGGNPIENLELRRMSPADFAKNVFAAAQQLEGRYGVPAAITTAQTCEETGYGKKVPSDIHSKQYSYNLFGIKGTGPAGSVESYTDEYINGKMVNCLGIFRAYPSFVGSLQGRLNFFAENPRYHFLVGNYDNIEWAKGLQKAGYANDPNCASKLISIMRERKLI